MKSKALIIDPYVQIAGPHLVIARFIQAVQGGEWEFIAVVPAKGPTYEHLVSMGLQVEILPGVLALRRGLGLATLIKLFKDFIDSLRKIVVLIRRENIRLVHSTTVVTWIGGVAARFAHIPSVYHVHDINLAQNILLGTLIGGMVWLTGDEIICVSKSAMAAFPLHWLNRKKLTVVYNFVDLDEFQPNLDTRMQIRKELGVQESAFVIGTFGGIDHRKGQDVFIRAAELVRQFNPQVHFYLVGSDNSVAQENGFGESIKKLSLDLGLYDVVHFIPARKDVARFMQAFDLVIQPSRLEAGPLVPLEAMACGIPVIASQVGANPEEIIDGLTGFLFPVEDSSALSRAILKLLDDGQERRNMGIRGRERVRKIFNVDIQAKKILDIYDRHNVRPGATLNTN